MVKCPQVSWHRQLPTETLQQQLQVSSHSLSSAGSTAQREAGCCRGCRATTALKMNAGLSATNCVLSPDVSPESCKPRRRPQAGTCSVATRAVTGAATRPGRAARDGWRAPRLRGRCPHQEGFAGKPRGFCRCNHLLQGEPSSKYVQLAATVVACSFPSYVPG